MAPGTSFLDSLLFLSLMAVDVWCMTNAAILIRWLHPSRNMGASVRATYEVMCAVFLVAASVTLILAVALLWPQENTVTTPAAIRWLTTGAFIGAHAGLAIASQRARSFFMVPKRTKAD